MNAESLRNLVNDELRHIPMGTAGSPQNELRMIYNTLRVAELARDEKLPRSASFAKAVAMVRERSPCFNPALLDRAYFRWNE